MEDEDRELIIMFSKNVELYNLVKSSFSKEVEAPDWMGLRAEGSIYRKWEGKFTETQISWLKQLTGIIKIFLKSSLKS